MHLVPDAHSDRAPCRWGAVPVSSRCEAGHSPRAVRGDVAAPGDDPVALTLSGRHESGAGCAAWWSLASFLARFCAFLLAASCSYPFLSIWLVCSLSINEEG